MATLANVGSPRTRLSARSCHVMKGLNVILAPTGCLAHTMTLRIRLGMAVRPVPLRTTRMLTTYNRA